MIYRTASGDLSQIPSNAIVLIGLSFLFSHTVLNTEATFFRQVVLLHDLFESTRLIPHSVGLQYWDPVLHDVESLFDQINIVSQLV